MDYAIITLNNNQILIKPGKSFSALGELGKVGDVITTAKVLLIKDEDKVEIGTPYLDKKLNLTIRSVEKTPKVEIFKYKAKSRYRRKLGHRQTQTNLELAAPTTAKKESKTKATTKSTTAKTK